VKVVQTSAVSVQLFAGKMLIGLATRYDR